MGCAWVQDSSKEALLADPRMERVTAAIIARSTQYSAADVFQAFAALAHLQAQARVQMAKASVSARSLVMPPFRELGIARRRLSVAGRSAAGADGAAELPGRRDRSRGEVAAAAHVVKERAFGPFHQLCQPTGPSCDRSAQRPHTPPGPVSGGERTARSAGHHPSRVRSLPATERGGKKAGAPSCAEVEQRGRLLRDTGSNTPHLPFGVTLIGPAWTDAFLWEVGADMHSLASVGCGPTGHGVRAYRQSQPAA